MQDHCFGVALHQGTSFPVGKVQFLDLYPLDFNEFLDAIGEKKILELIESNDFELIKSFKTKIKDYLKQYYIIGGMPSAIMKFLEIKDYEEVRNVQLRLLDAYEQDFSKHAPNEIVPRLRMLWNNIPSQLAKENKKFVYGLIRQGARAKEYELAMTWLIDCGLIHKIHRITKPNIPLNAYQDFNAFKLFILDVGLLGAMTKLDAKVILDKNEIFTEFKGALTEQFVLQQLVTNKDLDIYYWSADNSSGEIDFVLQIGTEIIPLEVKAEENLQAKSLKTFCAKYNLKKSVRTSMSDYREEESILNLPLYTINNLERVIKNKNK